MTFVKFMEWEFSERERNNSATRAPRCVLHWPPAIVRVSVVRVLLPFALLRPFNGKKMFFGPFVPLLQTYEVEDYPYPASPLFPRTEWGMAVEHCGASMVYPARTHIYLFRLRYARLSRRGRKDEHRENSTKNTHTENINTRNVETDHLPAKESATALRSRGAWQA